MTNKNEAITKELIEGLLKRGIDYLDLSMSLYMNCNNEDEVIQNIKDYEDELKKKYQTTEIQRVKNERQAEINSNELIRGLEESIKLSNDEIYVNELYDNGEMKDLKEYALDLLEDTELLKEKLYKLESKNDTSLEVLDNKDITDTIDVSGKVGYDIKIPSSPDILKNIDIDYHLIYLIAYASNQIQISNKNYKWILDKEDITNVIKPLYDKHRNTFNKKFKAIVDKGILTPIMENDKETGDYEYNYKKDDLFISVNIEKILPLILTDGMHDKTYKLLTYIHIHCRAGEKCLSYKYMYQSIGAKGINNEQMLRLLTPLVDTDLIIIRKKDMCINKKVTMNYYRVLK